MPRFIRKFPSREGVFECWDLEVPYIPILLKNEPARYSTSRLRPDPERGFLRGWSFEQDQVK